MSDTQAADDGFITVDHHEFPDEKVDWEDTTQVAGTLVWREGVTTTGQSGEPRETTFYCLADPDGAQIGIWGTANLDQQLKKVPDGAQVRITQGAKRKLSKGRTMRVFEVAFKV